MIDTVLSNFSGGEVSSDVRGRFESDLYKNVLERCQNYFSLIQGAAQYRGGTSYYRHTRLQNTARQERFRFNDEQTYILEFTDSKLRIFEDASVTLESTSDTITGLSQADPGVVTATGHSFSTNDEVYIDSVVGMTEVNERFFRVVKIDANSFSLKDSYGNTVDTSGYTAYSSGGTATKVYELTSPYPEADLFEFQFDQEGNTAYFVHRDYQPYKLTRVSATSWTFATYSRTADPFTGADKYPGAVTFYEGCLYFASSNDNPDRIWRSRGPDSSGASRYDDYTTGSDADHAIITVDRGAYIQWLIGLKRFIVIGTEQGVDGMDGGGDAAITPTNYRIRPIDPSGVQGGIMPAADGQSVFFMQKGSRILNSFEYDLLLDDYRATDRTFVASHLTQGGIKQLALQRWKTRLLWAVRNDGVLLCLTIKPKEDPTGWHRHYLGGTDVKVLSISVEPQVNGYDRLNLVVERTINSVTVRYNEYLNDPYEGINQDDYFTGVEATDLTNYLAAVFAAQQDAIYLDGSLTYDGAATSSITGLWHLEGETVSVLADGAKHIDATVSDGAITLEDDYEVVHVGYKYKGIVIPLDITLVGQVQNTIDKAKNISRLVLVVSHTVGVKYGTSLYNLQEIPASEIGQDTDAPPVPFTGVLPLANDDNWDENKRIIYVQDDPYPCMLNAMGVVMEVGDQ